LNGRLVFGAVAILAVGAGGGSWWLTRAPREPSASAPSISTGALWAASFKDTNGASHTLGEFQGQVLVLNFWATWCAPCREEMPAFVRLQDRWKMRGIRFLGLSDEEPAKVERFAAEIKVNYPLWVGSEAAGELSRRLGNRL
jgi:thiol-disulfide isomerase/thioredoxin